MRKMVNVELGNEIECDVCSSCHERGTEKVVPGIFSLSHAPIEHY